MKRGGLKENYINERCIKRRSIKNKSINWSESKINVKIDIIK